MNLKTFAARLRLPPPGKNISLKYLALTLLAWLCGGINVSATLIWDGSPSKGLTVFKSIHIQEPDGSWEPNPSPNGSSVTVANDAAFGQVWRFNKAAADHRCEGNGASGVSPKPGNTFYIGWGFNLNTLAANNAIFQWKTGGSSADHPLLQNYPLILSITSSKTVHLLYYDTNRTGHTLWEKAISPNVWYKVYLKIVVSDSTTGGRVQFWFNGSQQTFKDGSTTWTGRTYDGTSIGPKWGIYGADGVRQIDYVRHLRIGTGLSDVQF
jgi:hypothetical protein